MTQDLSNYTRDYYERATAEAWFPANGLLRPDELAAICYAHGQPFAGDEDYPPRDPGLVLSIGSGRGDLERRLDAMGVTVCASDPSSAAREYLEPPLMLEANCVDAVGLVEADTVIFCESAEHVPREQLLAAFAMLRRRTCRVIIVNWMARFPIEVDPSGWDHITRCDDALYDTLSEGGQVRVRRGTHLVIDFGGTP